MSLLVPVHATIGWETGAYECRSAATAGFCAEWDILDPKFPLAKAKSSIAEILENRKYWTGDYYPLTPWTMAPDRWMAWQLHRPDLDAGMILAFRHQECPYSAMQVKLRGIRPERAYIVEFVDEQHHAKAKIMLGEEFSGLELRIPGADQSLLVRYKPKM